MQNSLEITLKSSEIDNVKVVIKGLNKYGEKNMEKECCKVS